MKKGFLGGMFGCLGVGAAIIVVIIVIVVIASAGKGSTGGGSTSGTPGNKVLLDVSGNGQKTTGNFKAPDNWTIDYNYDCASFGASGNFAIMVQGDTTELAANQVGKSGTDKANVHGGGNVYLTITSECSWHVTAKG